MKKLLTLLGTTALLQLGAQNFTWVSGTSTIDIPPTYGTQGVPSSSSFPGARHGCAKWVDASGNLWLFGGEADAGDWFSDLWKYTVSTNQWTWVRGSNTVNAVGNYGTMGVAAPTNEPGAREFPASWTDSQGNFWMFGGTGFANSFGILGDLWKYDPSTNQWTWVNGFNTTTQSGVYGTQGTAASGNKPGCRYGASSWNDASGNLWLFGGRGLPAGSLQGYLNDLWKYNPSTNQWTWMSGATSTNQHGQYGTLSVPSTTNVPGARYFGTVWQDYSSNLYLFGGFGFANQSIPGAGHLNDLWKFDVSAGTWTWLNGPDQINSTGNYGTLGIPSATNIPGARFSNTSWSDASGNLWLFGGEGWEANAANGSGELNDLFRYNIANNTWTWMHGTNMLDQNGVYGTQGVPAPANVPGGRMYNTWWKTPDGRFWLYGGEGFDGSQSADGNNNDLWTFTAPCNPDSVTIAPGNNLCAGVPVVLTAYNGGPSTQWYASPTSTLSLGSGTVLNNSTLTAVAGPSVYTYYAEANSCTATPRPSVSFTVNPVPSLSVTASQTLICKDEIATFTASGASSYTWSVAQQTTAAISITASTAGNFTYTVTGANNFGCSSSAISTLQVSSCTGIFDPSQAASLNVFPNPSKGEFYVSGVHGENSELIIINALGQTVHKQALNSGATTTVRADLKQGVYFYQIATPSRQLTAGKLVIE